MDPIDKIVTDEIRDGFYGSSLISDVNIFDAHKDSLTFQSRKASIILIKIKDQIVDHVGKFAAGFLRGR